AVRVLTYNIQQGYSESGLRNFAGQLDLIRSVDADIIGLQESDTNRIAGGNADVVRYLADALEMHAYHGPKTVAGTFGIALLSKYPIENPQTFYMFSEGEQTATIAAEINVGGPVFHVFVTHLGNGGPLRQQEAIMQAAAGKAPLILMGDFNFRPDSDPYQLTTAVLDDAWLRLDEADRNPEPSNRIDHIFISPEVRVESVRYILDPASDHPAATAVLAVP
ncbi:MAG: endonuclease/exonuclease/phosphatase family protein, partial [Anaerolineae bacterium]